MFTTGEWRRLIPTSWSIFPGAWHAALTYASFHLVETPGAYNPLQQLAYFVVVFLLAPFTILTGLAMSPSISGRFPWYIKAFHGRQTARSLHFLCLCAFTAFVIGHVTMVVLHGFSRELALIVLGQTKNPDLPLALALGLLGIAVIVVVHVLGTEYSLHRPRMVQRRTQALIDPVRIFFFGRGIPAQHYSPNSISPYFRVNGRPPKDPKYEVMAKDHFASYRLEISGFVEKPLLLSLDELRAMPKQTQITKHCCIQGWSAIAEWGGVSMSHIMALCRPFPDAAYIIFYGMDDKSKSEPEPAAGGFFYGTIHIAYARNFQTILAYEMNGQPLPIEHGAPLRLRLETQLGFTMVKYIQKVEFIHDFRSVGLGQGGWREDHQYYSPEAGI